MGSEHKTKPVSVFVAFRDAHLLFCTKYRAALGNSMLLAGNIAAVTS
jgi:hypothetical protein